MSLFDPFGPANAFWSLFGFALAPSQAQFLEGENTAAASSSFREEEVSSLKEDGRQAASASVSTMLLEESPPLKEAMTALSGNRGRTEAPQWLSQHFSVCDETYRFKIFIPSEYSGQPLPLIVMLHGAHQNPDDFAAGTGMNAVAEEAGYIVLYPEQSESANLMRCWNWFRPENRTRDVGETATISALTRHVIATYNVDYARVYVAGLSAGGAMAVNLAVTYPDLYAAAAIHSGVPFGVADEHLSALCAMNDGRGKIRLPEPMSAGKKRRAVPFIVFHGDADDTVHPDNGEQIVAMNRILHSDPDNTPSESMHIHAGAETYASTRHVFRKQSGALVGEQWIVHGLGHAWSGGHPDGSYTDLRGPYATQEIVRFFEQVCLESKPDPADDGFTREKDSAFARRPDPPA